MAENQVMLSAFGDDEPPTAVRLNCKREETYFNFKCVIIVLE